MPCAPSCFKLRYFWDVHIFDSNERSYLQLKGFTVVKKVYTPPWIEVDTDTLCFMEIALHVFARFVRFLKARAFEHPNQGLERVGGREGEKERGNEKEHSHSLSPQSCQPV